MQFSTTQDPAIQLAASCIVVSIDDKGQLSGAAESINQVAEQYLTDIFDSGDFSGKTGETLMLIKVPGITAQRLILVGSGKTAVIDFDGDSLIQFKIDDNIIENALGIESAVNNSGTIQADGGRVLLQGNTAQNIFNTSGR